MGLIFLSFSSTLLSFDNSAESSFDEEYSVEKGFHNFQTNSKLE